MNYLAHIQLAHVSKTSMLGNFLGDFVKGSDLQHLPPAIAQGIKLHRSIDTFTDAHEIIRTLKQRSPTSIRRMMGVVIDMYFDHLLCKHWPNFNTHTLQTTTALFYQELKQQDVKVSGRYTAVKEGLLKYRWLADYASVQACERGFYSIERRLKGKVEFAEQAGVYIANESAMLEEAFLVFYPQLIAYVHDSL